jgi:hypothetical protein
MSLIRRYSLGSWMLHRGDQYRHLIVLLFARFLATPFSIFLKIAIFQWPKTGYCGVASSLFCFKTNPMASAKNIQFQKTKVLREIKPISSLDGGHGGLGDFSSPYLCRQAVTRSTITKGFLLGSRVREGNAKEEA